MTNPNLIAQTFGTGLKPTTPGSGGIADFDTSSPLTSLELLISNIIGLLTTLGALIFVFMFFYGALRWITGGDDAAKIQKARDQMVQGVIGLVIMVAGYAVIGLIGTMIGIDILTPADQITKILNSTGGGN